MLLITLRHQVERELVRLAALAADDGSEISGQQYQEKIAWKNERGISLKEPEQKEMANNAMDNDEE